MQNYTDQDQRHDVFWRIGRSFFLALVYVAFFATPALRAATETGTWTAGDGTGFSWNTAANWSVLINGNPVSTYPNATIAQVTIGNNVGITLPGTYTVNTLSLSGSTTLSNGTLVLGGISPQITTTTGGTLVLSTTTLQLSSTFLGSTISTAAGTSVDLGNVTGTAGLTLTGSGTVTLGGTFSASGGIDVNSGTLLVTGTSAVANLGNGELNVGNTNPATVVISNGGTAQAIYVFAGYGSSSGTLTVTGTGSSLTAGSLYVGFDGTGGDLAISNAAKVTTGNLLVGHDVGGGSGTVTVDGAGSTLDVTSANGFSINNGSLAITNGGTLETTATGTYPALIGSGAGGAAGAGTVTVSGTGSVWNNSGDLHVGDNTGGSATGTLTISAGGVVTTGTVTLGVSSGNQGTVDLEAGGTLATTQIAAGSGTATLIFNGGTLQATANSSAFISNFTGTEVNLESGGGTIDNNGYAITINSPLTGTGSATFIGSGTTELTGTNTYTGGTTISSGVLEAKNHSALGTGAVTVDSGASLQLNGGNGNITVTNAITISGTGAGGAGAIYNSEGDQDTVSGNIALAGDASIISTANGLGFGGLTLSGTVSLGTHDLTLAGNNDAEIALSGQITGSGGLIVTGSAGGVILAPSTSNTYTGTTTVESGANLYLAGTPNATAVSGALKIDGGTVYDQSTGQLASSSVLTLTNGGKFEFAGTESETETIAGLNGDAGTSLANDSGTSAALILNETGTNTYTFAGNINDAQNSFSLTKEGTGTQILSGNNNYVGGTTIMGGILEISSENNIGGSGNAGGLTLGGGELLTTANATFTEGVKLNAGTTNTLAAAANTTATFSGVISDKTTLGALTIGDGNNTGTVELTGSNTYTGGTTITGGVLEAANSSALGSGSVTVDSGAALQVTGGITLNTGTITLSGTGVGGAGALFSNGAGNQSVNSNITLAGNASISDEGSNSNLLLKGSVDLGANNLTVGTITFGQVGFSGPITGTGGITIVGASGGTVVMSGWLANTYTGTTTVESGGTLDLLASATAIPGNLEIDGGTVNDQSTGQLASSSVLTVTNNGKFKFAGGGPAQTETIAGLNGDSTASITNNSDGPVALILNETGTNTYTFSGNINDTQNSFSLTKEGTGTQVLSGTNKYVGGTTITGGILEISSENNIGGSNAGGLILGGGELLTTANATFTENVTLNSGTTNTLAAAANTTATYSGVISNTTTLGALTIGDGTNNGTVVLSGANTYTGGTIINGGTLAIGSGGSISSSSGVNLAASGATFDISGGGNQTIQDLSGVSGATVNLGGNNLTLGTANSTEFGGSITGSGALDKIGSGTLTLTGSNSYSGATTINFGTLAVSGTGAAITETSQLLVGDAGSAASFLITNGGQVANNGDTDIEGNGSVTVTGSGSSLTAANVYLQSEGDGNTATLTITDGAQVTTTAGYGYIGVNADSGTGIATVSGTGSAWTGIEELIVGSTEAGSLTISNGGEVQDGFGFIGNSASGGNVTVTGAGSLWINSDNLNVAAGADTTGTLTISNGGQVQVGATAYIGGDEGGGNGTGVVTVTGTGSLLSVAGPVELGAEGSGTLTVSNGASVTASSVILSSVPGSQATVNLDSGGVLRTDEVEFESGTASLNFDGGTLTATGTGFFGQFITNATGTDIQLLSGGGTIDNGGYDITIAAPFTGVGGLTSTGTGVLSLTGNNSYTGGTTVNEGTLEVASGGSITSTDSVLVDSTGTSTASLTVDGSGSRLSVSGTFDVDLTSTSTPSGIFVVGETGTGSLAITNGGTVNVAGTLTGFIDGSVLNSHASVIGDQAGSVGTVTVTGTGSLWNSGDLSVGVYGSGTMTISNGGSVVSGLGEVGYNFGGFDTTGGVGMVTITGANSSWNVNGLAVGTVQPAAGTGTGTVVIADGGKLSVTGGSVLYNGSVTVDGVNASGTASSLVLSGGGVLIGTGVIDNVVGYGRFPALTVNVEGGGQVKSSHTTGIGVASKTMTVVNITGVDAASGIASTWTDTGTLYIGYIGAGMVNVEDGGQFVTSNVTVADYTTADLTNYNINPGGTAINETGTVNVTGVNANGTRSTWTVNSLTLSTDSANRPGGGQAFVNILNGGYVSATGIELGDNYTNGAFGHVTVNGVDAASGLASTLSVTGTVTSNWGQVTVEDGGSATIGAMDMSNASQLTVEGVNAGGAVSTLAINGNLATNITTAVSGTATVTGTILVADGGLLTTDSAIIGTTSSSRDLITITGTGSQWENTGSMIIGQSGTTTLNVSNGGTVTDSVGYIGYNSGSTSTVTVTGTGSNWTHSSNLVVGYQGAGTLQVSASGTVMDSTGYVGNDSGGTGTVTVTGTGSTWSNSSNLLVGDSGTGNLTVSAGGTVSNVTGYIGNQSGSTGTVTVTGTGSTWTNSGQLYVGDSGTGTLTVSNGGTVNAADVSVSTASIGQGTINLESGGVLATGQVAAVSGTAGAFLNFNGGILRATGASGDYLSNFTGTEISLQSDGGTIDNNGYAIAIISPITGIGGLTFTGNATTTLTSTNTYAGNTTVSAGTLIINGSTLSTGLVSVASGATLGGTGSTGIVTVAGGGNINLQDGKIGTLTVGGLTSGGDPSAFFFDIQTVSGTTTVDSINDTGTLTLNNAGGTTITIANLGSSSTLVDGSYALITYTGTQVSLDDLTLTGTILDGQRLSLTQNVNDDTIYLTVTAPISSTTYDLGASASDPRVISGGTTQVTTTITNTGTGTADGLNYTGLTTTGTVSGGLPTSGGPLANNGGTASGTGTLAVGTRTGTFTVAPIVGSVTNATIGGSATLDLTGTTTVDVVANRVVTATSVDLGRVMVDYAINGTSTLTTIGDDADYTRVTVGNAATDLNGISTIGGTSTVFDATGVSSTRTLSGSFSTTGNISGTLTLLTTGEGLAGESPINVALAYTADSVANRTESATAVDLGRVMVDQTASGTTTISSVTGEDDLFTRTTLEAGTQTDAVSSGTITLNNSTSYTFGGANDGTNLTTAGISGNFTAAGTQSGTANFILAGEGLAGEQVNPVSVAYTADALNKRVITNGAITNLGVLHNDATVNTTSNAFTTTGTHDTTTDVSVAAGSGVSDGYGIALSGSATTFNGTNSSGTRTLSGTIINANGGTVSGSFNLAVTTLENGGAGLTGEGAYNNVNVAYTAFVYTGQGVWNTNGGGSWGAVSSTPANWTANGGTPGLDSNFTSTDSATFGSALTEGSATVTLDGDNPSLNAITFNDAAGTYILAQGTSGTITLNGGANSATVSDLAGLQIISAPVALATSANINVAADQQLILSGDISGNHGLAFTGAGTTLLSGTNSYIGNTTINAGVLAVGNSAALGTGSVTNNAILTTANDNHLITINGNYTEGANATLLLNLYSPTMYDSLHLTGNGVATLNGTLSLNLVGGFDPGSGQTFTLVTTNEMISGTFSTITTNLASIGLVANYTNDVTVLYQKSFVDLLGSNLTPNQKAVATYIDAHDLHITNPAFGNLVSALNSISNDPQSLASAFNELTTLNFANFASSNGFNNASFMVQQFDSYLANHRSADGTFVGSNGGIDYSGLSVNDPNIDTGLQSVRSRLLAWSPAPGLGLLSDTGDPVLGGVDMKNSDAVLSSPTNLWNVFVSGNVVLAQNFSDASAGIPYGSSTTGAVQVGADYKITPHWLAGVTFGYGHTNATLDALGSKASVNTYSPGIYTSYAKNGWYANALASYGFTNYTQSRDVSIGAFNGTAHSSPSGGQVVADLDGGYDFHSGNWTFGPTLGTQFVHLNVDGYTETGLPGADLTVNEDSSNSFRSLLGGRVSYAVKSGDMIFTPHLSASWQHEFLDQSRGITSQFSDVGAGSFVVNTPNPSRESALVDVGFDAQVNNALTIFTDYSVQAGQSNYFGQSVQAGVKIGF